jgi:hypothetical protein
LHTHSIHKMPEGQGGEGGLEGQGFAELFRRDEDRGRLAAGAFILLPTGEGAPKGRMKEAGVTELCQRKGTMVAMAASLTPTLSRRARESFRRASERSGGNPSPHGRRCPEGADEGGRRNGAVSERHDDRGDGSFPHPDPLPEGEGGLFSAGRGRYLTRYRRRSRYHFACREPWSLAFPNHLAAAARFISTPSPPAYMTPR